MEKHCANCTVPFECAAPSPECWCLQVPAWQPVRAMATQQYAGCLCKTCLSLLKFWSPEQLHTIWRL
jgi:cysteine-rich CWC protein